MRTAANLAPVVTAHLKLGFALPLFNQRFLGHSFPSFYAALNGMPINFSEAVRVEPGATVSFLFASNTTQQGTSKVLVWDNENITGVVEDIPVVTNYTVTFKDWNGTVLKTETVASGGNATPPASPSRTGYTFSGWSGSYTNVTSNRTVTAQWESAAYVWKHISGSWQKVLFLKKMTGGSWTDLPALHNHNGGSWS